MTNTACRALGYSEDRWCYTMRRPPERGWRPFPPWRSVSTVAGVHKRRGLELGHGDAHTFTRPIVAGVCPAQASRPRGNQAGDGAAGGATAAERVADGARLLVLWATCGVGAGG